MSNKSLPLKMGQTYNLSDKKVLGTQIKGAKAYSKYKLGYSNILNTLFAPVMYHVYEQIELHTKNYIKLKSSSC